MRRSRRWLRPESRGCTLRLSDPPGGGSLAKFCYRHLPDTCITVVEINPHVIALRDEFKVPPDDRRFRVVEADGVHFAAHTAISKTVNVRPTTHMRISRTSSCRPGSRA